MDINQLYLNIDKQLWESDAKLMRNIGYLVEADNHYTKCKLEYEKKYADTIQKLESEGVPATTVKERAKRFCLEESAAMLQAKTIVHKFEYYIRAGEKHIDTIKRLMSWKAGQ